MKKILGIYSSSRQHRIGDGLLAHTLFSKRMLGRHVSPFLLLDHVGSADSTAPDACARQLYRGCNVLTMVQQGRLEYVDADGRKQVLNAGDVQWRSVTDEHDAASFRAAAAGGNAREASPQVLQLWIDVPTSASLSCSGKIVTADKIPSIALPDGAGSIRVIAGDCLNRRGAMPTMSSFDVWQLQLKSRCLSEFNTVEGRTLLLAILSGSVLINGDHAALGGEVVMLDRPGAGLLLETRADTTALLLSGEPVDAGSAVFQ
ncbi:pirin family protein [Herbaspirillum lusitanum]|uniref:pirin family protein n=1 Tax=Herbaspirillum lusitanum TaxID=213312 RepID=UPI002237F4E7|nr:pirin family protein [Herbaspirillum lusitanum]MCW5296954.1 pirin family protein [Herbaspirillum lusitanum]